MKNVSTNKDSGRIFAGVILVIIGAGWLLRNSGFYIPGWLSSWPMILIAVGIYTGIKHNFRNNSWIIMLGIGGFFLLDQIIPGISVQPFFWPVAIIVVGLLFILRPPSYKNEFVKKEGEYVNWEDVKKGNGPAVTPNANAISDDNDYLRLRSIFSGVNRIVLSKNFKGAFITAIFGGVDINFGQADFAEPVIIRLEVVFGGIQLRVPANWTVVNEIDGIFHGIEDKRKNLTIVPDPTKKVILRGSAVFGGIEIKNA